MAHSELGRSLGGKEFYSCKACDETPFKKVQLGHDGEPQGFWDLNLVTDEKLTRCPVRLLQLASEELREEVLRWKQLYFPLYRKGHLLVEGGISAQPARWLAAMQFLEELESKMESKYLELKKAEDAET